MDSGFDFTTSDVQDWEIEAIWAAIDEDALIISAHAQNELLMDALHTEDVLDAISHYDTATKDLPDNSLRRAPGINFERHLSTLTIRVKVGWRSNYYIVVTAMAN